MLQSFRLWTTEQVRETNMINNHIQIEMTKRVEGPVAAEISSQQHQLTIFLHQELSTALAF